MSRYSKERLHTNPVMMHRLTNKALRHEAHNNGIRL